MQHGKQHRPAPSTRLAFWYGKGGVGKSTTTLLLSLFAASHGERVLVVDLDPECGTSRDFLGSALPNVQQNLKAMLEAPVPMAPPVLASGVDNVDLLPCAPDEQRFFRHFPEQSTRLRQALQLLPAYRWVMMDTPNQFDNIAELGMIAADHVILPVELTADCSERVPTALRIIADAQTMNPALHVVGALALASAPRAGNDRRLSAKELLIYREYEEMFRDADIAFFRTVMFRSATTVEEARSNADIGLLHWTARRRFDQLYREIKARIRTFDLTRSPTPHGQKRSRRQSRRKTATTNA